MVWGKIKKVKKVEPVEEEDDIPDIAEPEEEEEEEDEPVKAKPKVEEELTEERATQILKNHQKLLGRQWSPVSCQWSSEERQWSPVARRWSSEACQWSPAVVSRKQ